MALCKEVEVSKNKDATVSGMLLYAMSEDNQLKNNDYQMSGNTISVRTLNLNCEFDELKRQLNRIVDTCVLCC